MSKTLKDITLITLITLITTFLIWLPFILNLNNFLGLNFSQGFSSIYRNFDGLEYVIIAKSFYDPILISQIPQNLPASYFPSHFPLYSIFIAIFAPLLGYLKSMLFVSLLFTITSAIAFYFLVKDFKLTSQPLYLSVLFLLLPARWIIVHSVGSAEPVFIFFVILTIYFFKKFLEGNQSKYLWYTGLMLALTQLTRPPGIILFIALMLFPFFETLKKHSFLQAVRSQFNYYPLLLGPVALILMFFWFQLKLGDFWAYFQTGDNIHLFFPPFSVFNKYQYWVGDIWLEDIIYIFLLGFTGGLILLKSNLKVAGIFVLTYLVSTIFVAHRDISRYTLPAVPFVIIAFEKFLISKEFKIAMIIIALGLYLYSQNFLIENTAPIANLEYFD